MLCLIILKLCCILMCVLSYPCFLNHDSMTIKDIPVLGSWASNLVQKQHQDRCEQPLQWPDQLEYSSNVDLQGQRYNQPEYDSTNKYTINCNWYIDVHEISLTFHKTIIFQIDIPTPKSYFKRKKNWYIMWWLWITTLKDGQYIKDGYIKRLDVCFQN